MDHYLQGENEKYIFVNLNKKEDAIFNDYIKSFTTNNNLNPENVKTISATENEILNRFFTQELKISPESSYVLISENKILTIQ